ncbi:MAG: hypothetical protein FJ206_13695 [Gemmatimonadetes bacterium]|nr:hypothetical protein [Gemmatimonadota bacterium]
MARLYLLATVALATVATVSAAPSAAQQVEFQLFSGSAVSLPLPIEINQAGQADLSFTAHWATHPTRPTWYYAGRLGLWNGNRGWRLDFTHHKLYLTNPPPEIQEFRITNGFNIITLSRAFRRNRFSYSLGAGPVITFPVNTIRGQQVEPRRGLKGYLLSGASVMGMATREFGIAAGLFASLDARGSASWVRVPVAGGRASVPNVALHLHAGLGYRFGDGR